MLLEGFFIFEDDHIKSYYKIWSDYINSDYFVISGVSLNHFSQGHALCSNEQIDHKLRYLGCN